jgi:hypothetical protein
VDGGERTAQPFNFAEWEIRCPRDYVVAGTSIGYGALEPVSDLSYGTGVLVTLANPSDSTPFSGSAEVHCVWGLHFNRAAAAGVMSRSEALAAVRKAKQDRLASR